MNFVFAQDFAVGFHPRSVAVAVMTGCGAFVLASGILVDPRFLQPFPRICFIRCNQVKVLCVNARRMAKWLYVARHQEIEGFDFVDVFLSFIELRERAHDGGTGDRRATNCGLVLKSSALRSFAEGFVNHAQPYLCNPSTILAFGISWIQKMTKSVLGPAIFLVVRLKRLVTVYTVGNVGFVVATTVRTTATKQRGGTIFLQEE